MPPLESVSILFQNSKTNPLPSSNDAAKRIFKQYLKVRGRKFVLITFQVLPPLSKHYLWSLHRIDMCEWEKNPKDWGNIPYCQMELKSTLNLPLGVLKPNWVLEILIFELTGARWRRPLPQFHSEETYEDKNKCWKMTNGWLWGILSHMLPGYSNPHDLISTGTSSKSTIQQLFLPCLTLMEEFAAHWLNYSHSHLIAIIRQQLNNRTVDVMCCFLR